MFTSVSDVSLSRFSVTRTYAAGTTRLQSQATVFLVNACTHTENSLFEQWYTYLMLPFSRSTNEKLRSLLLAFGSSKEGRGRSIAHMQKLPMPVNQEKLGF